MATTTLYPGCRCPLCVVLATISVLLVTAGLVALALYLLLFRPHVVTHASVDAADLAAFTLEPRTWILRYNLTLAVRLRNPNDVDKRAVVAVQYRHVRAQAYYQGQRFAYDDRLPDLFQDGGGDSTLYPAFLGQIPLVGGVAAAGFRREAVDDSTFSIDVRIDARTRLKLWVLRVPGPDPKIDCPLRIRRRNRDTGELLPGSFYPTQCRVSF